VVTVVVGKGDVLASKEAHRAMVLAAVPVISINNCCQCVGVPVRLVVIDVISTASAVILCISVLSVFIVGVADDASDVTLSVTLLFVSVCVAVNHTICAAIQAGSYTAAVISPVPAPVPHTLPL